MPFPSENHQAEVLPGAPTTHLGQWLHADMLHRVICVGTPRRPCEFDMQLTQMLLSKTSVLPPCLPPPCLPIAPPCLSPNLTLLQRLLLSLAPCSMHNNPILALQCHHVFQQHYISLLQARTGLVVQDPPCASKALSVKALSQTGSSHTCLAVLQIYAAPVVETFETRMMDEKGGLWTLKNWFIRTALRCFYIFLAALLAAMFPYFGDILSKRPCFLSQTPPPSLLPADSAD